MARAMKDSGVEWTGDIPEGWGIEPLKRLFSFGKGLPITRDQLIQEGLPVISYGQVHSKSNPGTRITADLIRYVSTDYAERYPDSYAGINSFIIADTSEDMEGCGNSVYNDSVGTLFAGYHSIILRPSFPESARYYAYFFKSSAWRTQVQVQVSGVKVFSISQKILKNTLVLNPPKEEQQRIADFLDTRTSDIDASIAKTQESIEEYKKLKQAVITQAVTKGIRPGRVMKDSGVEWIGDIPEEWRMAKVSHFFSITRGRVIPIDSLSPDAPYPVFSSQTQNNGCMGFLHSYDIEGESLTWTTDGANAGTVFYRTGKYNCTNVCGVLQPLSILKSEVILKFISYSLGYSAHICRRADINGYKIMSNEMAGIKFTLPPVSEQQEIAAYLDEKCAAIDTLIEKKQAIITELEAYKKSLIYEYVTGKKEVPMASC